MTDTPTIIERAKRIGRDPVDLYELPWTVADTITSDVLDLVVHVLDRVTIQARALNSGPEGPATFAQIENIIEALRNEAQQ